MQQFPKDFLWGSATSSYQIEGAANKYGRGPSIWDAFSHIEGRTYNGDHGDFACDHYHKYKEDVKLMANLGLKAYRFSISWSRIQPDGKGTVNQEGVQFYSNLIDELLKYGIEPWVTLYHWDLPLALEMENDGWLHPDIASYFEKYAHICFEHFGDRVKNWITLNEPWVVAILGYNEGIFAPGRKSKTEPYIVAHNLLRAHGKAVAVYRKEFKTTQKGKIGITNNCDWREPLTNSEEDIEAAQRALEFFLGWFADPIYFGDYPKVMRERLGERLPEFSKEDREMILGSSDFFGLNHYSTLMASNSKEGEDSKNEVYGNGGVFEDQLVNLTLDPKWTLTDMKWPVVPWGCEKLLKWIQSRYNNPLIYITENGCASKDETENGEIKDDFRLTYIKSYLEACSNAITSGVQLKGYFVWSLLDNFEWAHGYSKRFGIHYVDYVTGERFPKNSAKWYKSLIEANTNQKY